VQPFFHLFLTLFAVALHAGSGPDLSNRTAEGSTYFYRCSDGFEFVARFERNGVWLFLPQRSVELPFIDAREEKRRVYRNDTTAFLFGGEEASLDENGTLHTVCRNDRRRAIWEKAKLDGADFRATGNEPPWILEIRGDRLDFYFGYGKKRYTFHARPESDPKRRETRYAASDAETAFRVVLRPGPCRDSMADETYETSVEIDFGGRHLRGCGRALH
jgi:putative lipoprotein